MDSWHLATQRHIKGLTLLFVHRVCLFDEDEPDSDLIGLESVLERQNILQSQIQPLFGHSSIPGALSGAEPSPEPNSSHVPEPEPHSPCSSEALYNPWLGLS